MTTEHLEHCLICGAELEYRAAGGAHRCVLCGTEAVSPMACPEGHFVCDRCHGEQAIEQVLEVSRTTTSRAPRAIAEEMMSAASVTMHGPEHHVIVAAAILAAARNAGGADAGQVLEGIRRARSTPGGMCGYWGVCGSAAGAGIAVSVLTAATPLKGDEKQIATALSRAVMDRLGDRAHPRCCKRSTRVATDLAARFLETRLGVAVEDIEWTKGCTYVKRNAECDKRACPHYRPTRAAEAASILERVTQPTLLLDETRVRRNIERMVRKLQAAGVRPRPHFKTHQSAAIGEWFRGAGVSAITVSSLAMARYFAAAGWTDITLAFPLNLRQIDGIRDLCRRADIGLLVDDERAAAELTAELDAPARVWIKVDAGYHRAGIDWSEQSRIAGLARAIHDAENLSFAGLLAHAGDSYGAGSREEILTIHRRTCSRLDEARAAVLAGGIERCSTSIGDTPGCSAADDFAGVDEARPGNFVFYDLTQAALGSCADEDIAVALACPVVGVYPQRGTLVLYGGAIHLSKDSLVEPGGRRIYGYLARRDEHGWTEADRDCPLISVSQEHGVVAVESGALDRFDIGDVALVLPVHSCLTAEMFDEYLTLDGRSIPRMSSALVS